MDKIRQSACVWNWTHSQIARFNPNCNHVLADGQQGKYFFFIVRVKNNLLPPVITCEHRRSFRIKMRNYLFVVFLHETLSQLLVFY